MHKVTNVNNYFIVISVKLDSVLNHITDFREGILTSKSLASTTPVDLRLGFFFLVIPLFVPSVSLASFESVRYSYSYMH